MPVNLGPPAIPEKLNAFSFRSTVIDKSWNTSSFAGLNLENDHLSASAGEGTSSLMVSASEGESIVIYEILALSLAPANNAFICTFAEEDSANDIVVCAANNFGVCRARFENGYRLTPGKGLVIYRVTGDASDDPTIDFNVVTVSYAKA